MKYHRHKLRNVKIQIETTNFVITKPNAIKSTCHVVILPSIGFDSNIDGKYTIPCTRLLVTFPKKILWCEKLNDYEIIRRVSRIRLIRVLGAKHLSTLRQVFVKNIAEQ